jgi:hypothetical protein
MGRPPILPKKKKDGFYIEIRNKGAKSGTIIIRDTPQAMMQAVKQYETIASNEIKKCNYCKTKNNRCLTCRLKISKLGKDLRIKNLVSGLEQQPHQPTE